MSKKRRHFQPRKGSKSQFKQHNKKRTIESSRLENSLLTLLYKHAEPLNIKEIIRTLKSSDHTKKEISDALIVLLKSNYLVDTGKKKFSLNKQLEIHEGILERHPKGFGFVVHISSKLSGSCFKRDPFLSRSRIGSANHGDKLLIRIYKVRNNDRPEAEILSILERNSDNVTGFYMAGPPAQAKPEDPRFPHVINLLKDEEHLVNDGDAVIVKLLPSHLKGGGLIGKIIEVLGPPSSIDVQMRMVIAKFKLQSDFSPTALREANQLHSEIKPSDKRLDLRDINHVTIDGETAKDFDDAVAVIKTRKGYRLYVSIADVGYYVKEGSKLDSEAYQRGTSIYFPGRVIPMLPEKLSNNLCSLVPKKDRHTFTAILEFDRQGKKLNKSFTKSVICSKHRFTYTTVKNILIDKNPQIRRAHKEFLTQLKWFGELAEVLHLKRMDRGSIGFNLPEADITLNDDGTINTIRRAERNFAHQIIEEFMLAANEAVAETLTEQGTQALYRIHEHPSPEKVDNFKTFAKTLDLHLPTYQDDPAWFGKVLSLVKGSPKEYVVNNLLLRTMQQARYDSKNCGHFGLASQDYTHFTSPIRRYPDLIVHRKLDALLAGQFNLKAKETEENGLKEAGHFLSQRERTAIDAEREMNERLKLFFMEKFIGKTFQAIISGVTDFALFVELVELFVSGSIDLSEIRDDYYLFDAGHHRLIGEISGKIFNLGKTLEVTLLSIDHEKRRINFAPAATIEE